MNRKHKNKTGGFTLVELMIVVAIIGILATIAIAGYSKFITESKNSEAISVLSTISAKQETYRNRFGTYASATANPTTMPKVNQKLAWNTGLSAWKAIGVKPGGGFASFQYSTMSGTGSCTSPGGIYQNACGGINGGTWWWAVAENTHKIHYINSARGHVWSIDKQ